MEQEVNQNPEGSDTTASGSVDGDAAVSRSTYLKVLAAERNAKASKRELEEKLLEYERKEQEAKGNYESVITSYKKEVEDAKVALKKERENIIVERITFGIKTEAAKVGCENPDKLIKLLDKSDYETLKADVDGYTVKPESLQALVEKAKKENPFLFKSPAVKINDAVPSSRPEKPKAKNINEMSKEELEQAILALNKTRR